MKSIVNFIAVIALILAISGCSHKGKKTVVQPIKEKIPATVETNSTTPTVETNLTKETKAYLPDISIDPKQTVYVSTTKELQKAINSAKEGDTIILKAGAYNGVYIRDKKHLTLKSQEPHKASFSSSDPEVGRSAFKLYNSSYINILGFDSHDATYFVFAPSWKSSVHHIYIADCVVHNQKSGIYSGGSSHDWTVDRCKFYNLSNSSAWVALGYHHTLQNSILKGINNFYLTIRGYMPIGEVNRGKYPKYDKPPLRDREPNTYKRLSSDDWTHYVLNNVFGEGVSKCSKSRDRGAGIGFYIGGKNSKDNDVYHLPPQNVLIENNTFYKNRSSGVIFMDKEFGFSKADTSHGFPILGTVLKGNKTDQKSFITKHQKPDMSMIELVDNLTDVNQSQLIH